MDRQLTSGERELMQTPLSEYWVKKDGLLPKETRAFEAGFTGGLDTAAEQVAALTAERDGLRALVGRVVDGLPHTNYYQYYGDIDLRQLLKDCQEALK